MPLERAAVERAVATLNANFRINVPAETVDLWTGSLREFDESTVVAVVNEWNETRPKFPLLTEIYNECKRHVATLAAGGRGNARTCGRCDGLTWCESDRGMIPCVDCAPALNALWRDGHLDAGHNTDGCSLCIDYRKNHGGNLQPARRTGGDPVTEERANVWRRVNAALAARRHHPDTPPHRHVEHRTTSGGKAVRVTIPDWRRTCPRCGNDAIDAFTRDTLDAMGEPRVAVTTAPAYTGPDPDEDF